ncbi:MAG TPA: response regulator [Candidatus Brocadiia bacterium]|nr:response regulator [Candidatus Brocadiia bacterium]
MTQGRERRAIVVNDEPIQLRAIVRMLEDRGLAAAGFTSAAAALETLDTQPPPDLIVTDLHMPGMDGWGLCRLLRSPRYPALNRTPIIVVSATAAHGADESLARDLGQNVCILAPCDFATLGKRVDDAISGARSAPIGAALIVAGEDERKRLDHVFAAHGYATLCVPTPARARRAFKALSPCVAVIQREAAGHECDQLIRDFRVAETLESLVIITADPSPETALRALKAGADASVRLPYDPEYIISLTERHRREHAVLAVERMVAEGNRRLRRSDEALHRLIEAIPEAVWAHDPGGKILYANPLCVQTFLGPGASLVGRNLWDVLSQAGALVSEQTRLAIGATLRRLDLSGASPSGAPFHIEVNATPAEFEGRPAILCVARDITDRRHAEQERLRRERMQGALETAGAACHELNQPLQTLSAYAEMLAGLLPPNGPERRYADIMLTQAARMAQTTRKLNNITRYATREYLDGRRIIDLDQAAAAREPAHTRA